MERAYGLDIPDNLEEACRPERTALVVYDMQVGILRQLRDGAGVTARVLQVLQAARGRPPRVLPAAPVLAQRVGRRLPAPDGEGLAAGHVRRRSPALVPPGQPGVPARPGAGPPRHGGGLRQDHDVRV